MDQFLASLHNPFSKMCTLCIIRYNAVPTSLPHSAILISERRHPIVCSRNAEPAYVCSTGRWSSMRVNYSKSDTASPYFSGLKYRHIFIWSHCELLYLAIGCQFCNKELVYITLPRVPTVINITIQILFFYWLNNQKVLLALLLFMIVHGTRKLDPAN